MSHYPNGPPPPGGAGVPPFPAASLGALSAVSALLAQQTQQQTAAQPNQHQLAAVQQHQLAALNAQNVQNVQNLPKGAAKRKASNTGYSLLPGLLPCSSPVTVPGPVMPGMAVLPSLPMSLSASSPSPSSSPLISSSSASLSPLTVSKQGINVKYKVCEKRGEIAKTGIKQRICRGRTVLLYLIKG